MIISNNTISPDQLETASLKIESDIERLESYIERLEEDNIRQDKFMGSLQESIDALCVRYNCLNDGYMSLRKLVKDLLIFEIAFVVLFIIYVFVSLPYIQ